MGNYSAKDYESDPIFIKASPCFMSIEGYSKPSLWNLKKISENKLVANPPFIFHVVVFGFFSLFFLGTSFNLVVDIVNPHRAIEASATILWFLLLWSSYIIYHIGDESILFDKTKGTFQVQRKKRRVLFKEVVGEKKYSGKLDEIYAVQSLVGKVTHTNLSEASGIRRGLPFSLPKVHTECNLVLKDGSRIHVRYSLDLNQENTIAKTIADFLQVPLWDMSLEK